MRATARRRALSGAQHRCRTSADLQGADRRLREGRRASCGAVVGAVSARRSCVAYMGHVQDNAEEAVRRVLGVLKDGELRVRDGRWLRESQVDDHASTARRGRAVVDFTGTSGAAADQFQRAARRSCAPPCCTSSAPWSTTTSR